MARRVRAGLAGTLLVAIGVFHEVAGLFLFRAELAEIARAGVIDSVMPSLDPAFRPRQAAFWFMVSGPVLMMLGALARWAELRVGHLPGWLGWSVLALAVAGVALFTRSGFWLIFAPAILMIRNARACELHDPRTAP